MGGGSGVAASALCEHDVCLGEEHDVSSSFFVSIFVHEWRRNAEACETLEGFSRAQGCRNAISESYYF